MLNRLHVLSRELQEQMGSSQKPIFEKEMAEVERQVQVILTTVNEKIEYLEDVTTKWTGYGMQLDELRSWFQRVKENLENVMSSSGTPGPKADAVEVGHNCHYKD